MNVLVHALGEHNAWWVYTYLGVELLGQALCIFGFSRWFQSAFKVVTQFTPWPAAYELLPSSSTLSIVNLFTVAILVCVQWHCIVVSFVFSLWLMSLSIMHVLWPLGIFFSISICSSLCYFPFFLVSWVRKQELSPLSLTQLMNIYIYTYIYLTFYNWVSLS